MSKLKYSVCIVLLLFFVTENTLAQISSPDNRTRYWGDAHSLIVEQNNMSLGYVNKILEQHPPVLGNNIGANRRLSLYMIDQVLRQENAAQMKPVQAFYHIRIENIANELGDNNVSSGVKIWKLYNDGFIVQTASVTIGFDIVRGKVSGADGFAISNSLATRLVDKCDILFISNSKSNHADKWVAQAFIDQNKPVVAPPDVWKNELIYQKILHLQRKANLMQQVDVRDGGKSINVVVYPGITAKKLQETDNNAVVVITPEERVIAHSGGQLSDRNWDWVDKVKKNHETEVLLTDSREPNLKRVIKGFSPQLVLLGGENVFEDPIASREPYWMDFMRLKDIPTAFSILTWGENYHYK